MTQVSDYIRLQIEGSGMSFGTVWGDMMESAVTQWFAKSIHDKNARILDLGCGEGRGLMALKRLGFQNVFGLDINPEKVQLCKERGLSVWCGDLYSILDQEFDYVFTSHTLEHLPSIRNGLYLLNSITRHKIFYIVPVRETEDMVREHNPSHVSPINDPAEFTRIIDDLGLRHQSVELFRLCSELWGVIECSYVRSTIRSYCDRFVVRSGLHLMKQEPTESSLRCLYVGVAGDIKGGEYSAYFPNYQVTTLDVDPRWQPDVVGDITRTEFGDGSWDLVICSNVIEHLPEFHKLPSELLRIVKPGGYILVDCPWSYPYHAEPPSFGDYWRISLDGFKVLFHQFEIVDAVQTDLSTHMFCKKAQLLA